MSPRVQPKTKEYAAHLDEQARYRDAAHEFAAEKEAALERAQKKHGIPTPRGPSPYGIGSERSYFLDLVWAAGGEEQLRDQIPSPLVGSTGEARSRLTASGKSAEYRDLTTGATQGGGFVPTGPPAFIGEAFAEAARAASVMSSVLPVEPLPEKGMTLKTPRITTGTSTAVMATENSAVSETDIVESMLSNPIATIAGQQDLSQQLFDRADPGMVDIVLARELGRSLGQNFDSQVIAGTGASGQMLGLRAVTGIVSNAYTDATATQAEAFPVVAKTYADVATALGNVPTVILLHPRRSAWFQNWKDTATGAQAPLRWPAAAVEVPAIGTTYGAGTNEDEAYVLAASELPVYVSVPAFRVSFDLSGSGTLTARITAFQYISGLFTRRPEAIGKIAGTGLISPVFS